MKRNSKIALAALVIIALIAVGAGAVYYQGVYMPPAGSPTISITSPADGTTVTSSSVTVTISSTNFNVPTQGHYHIYLDNTLQMAFDQTSTVTFNNVAPGTHTITAYLANPDHSLVSPQVSQTITITVQSGGTASPTVSIISPANGATVTGTSVVVTMSSTDFNVPADGYYYVYMDNVNNFQIASGSAVTFMNVAPGTHTIWAQLYNLDGSPVSPTVVSPTATITVVAQPSASPTISIASPNQGDTVVGPAVTVTVSSTNFNVPTQGYYYVSMSNGGFITGNGPTFTFPSVTSGAHTITVDLRNPDGTVLNPDVSQTITITVIGGVGGGGY